MREQPKASHFIDGAFVDDEGNRIIDCATIERYSQIKHSCGDRSG